MRLKIDTETKIIQLEQSAKLTELFAFVKKLFPDNEWKEYTIEAVQHIYDWYNPIAVPFTYTGSPTVAPWPTITCETTKGQNTYCIQTN